VGNVANANVALVVSQAAQPNITSVGTLTDLTVAGLLVASNGSGISNVNASNVILGTLSASVFPTSGVTSGTYGSAANVSQVTVDTYGRVTTASNVAIVSSQWTTGTGNIYYLSNVGIGTSAVSANLTVEGNTYISNSLSTANAYLTGTLNVQGTSNLWVANIANIYTTNIVGFVGSQWTGQIGSPIYYINPVGIGTSEPTANLTVTGNVYVSNTVQTANLIIGGVTSGGFLQAQGTANVASVSTIPIGSGGTNQTSYGTTGGVVYYDGTSFQAASGIQASTDTTLNVATANITTLQTNSFIPAASGLFMNLSASYTLTAGASWTGNIAGTVTSTLYTLFAPLPGITGWNAYGSSAFVNAPTANGGIKFNLPGPYMITTVISADSGIKTIALSSNLGNTVDIHSNVTNVWQYCYRFPFGDVNPWPVTIPLYVPSTSQYYYIDYETNNTTDNIHKTAYTNTASEAYTGSYVIIRPV
jgi:hypothetical protein